MAHFHKLTAHFFPFEPFRENGEPFGPRPAAHSIFKNPREIDAYGRECGGAADGFGIGICRRGGGQPAPRVQNRIVPQSTKQPRARGARESVGVSATIGTSEFIQTSKMMNQAPLGFFILLRGRKQTALLPSGLEP